MKELFPMMYLLLSISIVLSSCSSSGLKHRHAEMNAVSNTNKILIVYLSRTSNTKAIAEIIQENVGGRLVALELEKPYPENYAATVQQVARENETGYLPPLKTRIDRMDTYDVVFVGFPTWGMQLPPPVKSFLKQYELRGKTVVPFNTNGGYGIGSSFRTLKELCPNSNVLQGFTIRGGSERDGQYLVIQEEIRRAVATKVKAWLHRIKLLKEAP